MMKKKPILHPGFLIGRKATVQKRLLLHSFAEVYLLSSNQMLVLFLDQRHDYLMKMVNQRLLVVRLGNATYFYSLFEDASIHKLKKWLDQTVNPIGIQAIVGMTEVKEFLIHDVVNVIKEPVKYKKFKLDLPNGILFFGPPGCGKTFIVRKLAEELSFHFEEVSPSELASIYVHGTVGKIGELFKKAIASKPSILFFDEIESFMPKRDSSGMGQHKQEEINEFLIQLADAGKNNILVVGATNKPHLMDEAILRPGRFDKIVYIPPPDALTRLSLFEKFLAEVPIEMIDFKKLASLTENYSISDIQYLCQESARTAIRNNLNHLTQDLILHVIQKTKPSLNEEMKIQFHQFSKIQRQ
jgi:transitional endoplasmic reticulum ATPase